MATLRSTLPSSSSSVRVASRQPGQVQALVPVCRGASSAWSSTSSSGCGRRSLVCFARSGGSVVDKPTTSTNQEKTTHKTTKRPPTYKVMLHNDNYNRREYVVKVLLKVVSAINVDDAVVVMQEAHESGVALVIACPQDEAEQYCEGLRLNGLTSSIEPGH